MRWPLHEELTTSLLSQDIHVHEAEENTKIETIEELFPLGSQCFMLASPHYGACGEVLEVDTTQGRVRVQLKVPVEPDILSVIEKHKVSQTGAR